jgi:transposase InsO family protein
VEVRHLTRSSFTTHQPKVYTGTKIVCASSAARRQNAFGCCATDLRLIRYSYFGTYATLPAHEGDERDEQRYKAVLAVIADGRTVSEVASDCGVRRQTMHRWLARYEGDGLEGLSNRSCRPARCPHQTPPAVEAMVLEMRRSHAYWGARRIAFELARKGVEPAPSESAVYRCLVRAAVIDPISRRRRRETWKRWERAAPMELWQLDLVHGFLLADGTTAKALTGIDDHSRFCVSARLMARERTQSVCDGFSSAMRAYGVPAQVLTDNGKVFTGRFVQPPVEVLFDRICL